MVYGRTDDRPQTVWGSRVGSYDNFNRSSPLLDNDAFEWELASTQINEVTALVPVQDLVVMTTGGEWRMFGGGGGSITAKSVEAVRQSQWYWIGQSEGRRGRPYHARHHDARPTAGHG